jgi:hypothetical protein
LVREELIARISAGRVVQEVGVNAAPNSTSVAGADKAVVSNVKARRWRGSRSIAGTDQDVSFIAVGPFERESIENKNGLKTEIHRAANGALIGHHRPRVVPRPIIGIDAHLRSLER